MIRYDMIGYCVLTCSQQLMSHWYCSTATNAQFVINLDWHSLHCICSQYVHFFIFVVVDIYYLIAYSHTIRLNIILT